MKSAGVFLATALLALMSGTVAGAATAAGETGGTGILVTASAVSDGDSGWGRSTGR
ncbi:hypothetical protein [Streptomyces sp. BBFR102]|uniref:hypothetical protein n=1 Tax=Streptomyces sp. BBFR102 TaxID=3448171 RepID=UPI003F53A822